MEQPYFPIACGFHDILLHHATIDDVVDVGLWVDDAPCAVQARIRDVFTRAGAEFILFDNGAEYRLDQLRSINGSSIEESACPI
jgi:transcriptional antiterminator Rof (Rho-off)